MLAIDLMTEEIPPLKITDTGTKAHGWMDEFKVLHLPVVNKGIFLGLISDTDILDLNHPEDPIGASKLTLINGAVSQSQHAFEVLKIISTLNLTALAVLDNDNHYIGIITAANLMRKFADMPFVHEPGGIIILELNTHDYFLSQIAQIIESNDAKIIMSYVTANVDSTKIELTLKLNKEELSGILQTLYRYNYTVKASFHQSEFSEGLKQRYDEFLRYLNI